MFPFGVAIPVTVPQRSKIPERLMNNPVYKYNALICGVDFQKRSQLTVRDIVPHYSGPQTLLLQNTGVPLLGIR
jgi:hypothetical protein